MSASDGNAQGAGGGSPGPFALHALSFHSLGLSCVPCGGDNGKRPLVRWTRYQEHRPAESTLRGWMVKHPAANVGLITGTLSGLTVIDCDDPKRALEGLEMEYGPTSFAVRTPRGGIHLYYRYNGERNAQGFAPSIDIRGQGGLIIAPGSANMATGKPYDIIKGTLEDLKSLPRARLPEKAAPALSQKSVPTPDNPEGKITKGQRNQALFDAAKKKAAETKTLEALKAFAVNYNAENLSPPLPDSEIAGTVEKVWQYKAEGRLLNKGQKAYFLAEEDFTLLSHDPRAVTLYLFLRGQHSHRKDFFILQEEVAERLHWKDRRRVGAVIKTLMKHRKIKRLPKKRKPRPESRSAWVYTFS